MNESRWWASHVHALVWLAQLIDFCLIWSHISEKRKAGTSGSVYRSQLHSLYKQFQQHYDRLAPRLDPKLTKRPVLPLWDNKPYICTISKWFLVFFFQQLMMAVTKEWSENALPGTKVELKTLPVYLSQQAMVRSTCCWRKSRQVTYGQRVGEKKQLKSGLCSLVPLGWTDSNNETRVTRTQAWLLTARWDNLGKKKEKQT